MRIEQDGIVFFSGEAPPKEVLDTQPVIDIRLIPGHGVIMLCDPEISVRMIADFAHQISHQLYEAMENRNKKASDN